MTRGNPLRPLAPVVAAVALTIGTAASSVVVAGPRDGRNRSETQIPEETDGASVEASLAVGETVVAQEEAPSIEFGSAAAGDASAPPAGRVEPIEPIIGEPTQEQIDAVQEPIATESLPVDQVGERDSDDDKVPDAIDNCPAAYNIDQSDDDGNGVGNACEPQPQEEAAPRSVDTDGDGVADHEDNCWQLPNPGQQDGDGDGLGNGCDEGSAPFLTPDEDEIVEAQRYVRDPTLVAGEPLALAAPEAANPTEASAGPIEVAEGGTVAAPDEPGRDRADDGGERRAAAPEPDNAVALAPPDDSANQSDRDASSDRGDERERRREGDDGPSSANDAGLSKVQQGERPRRNPALTEESGPVLPPPRSSKRYPLEPGFESVIRIDAGALGTGEASESKPRDDRGGRTSNRASSDEEANGRRPSREKEANTGASEEERDGGERSAARSTGEERSRKESSGPVPIEAGVVLESPRAGGGAPDDEPDDGELGRESGRVLTNIVAWQADDNEAERGDGEADDGDEGDVASEARERKERDGDRKRKERDRPEWDRDRHYRGGEATKQADVDEIAGTSDDDLYLTQRSGKGGKPDRFVYAIPVGEDGVYRVRLHFAETFHGADGGDKGEAGARVFDVDAEGEPALRDFDIYDEVGSMTAVVKMFDIEVDDGTLELEFEGQKGQPVVSAIEVLRHVGDPADEKAGWSNWSAREFWWVAP